MTIKFGALLVLGDAAPLSRLTNRSHSFEHQLMHAQAKLTWFLAPDSSSQSDGDCRARCSCFCEYRHAPPAATAITRTNSAAGSATAIAPHFDWFLRSHSLHGMGLNA